MVNNKHVDAISKAAYVAFKEAAAKADRKLGADPRDSAAGLIAGAVRLLAEAHMLFCITDPVGTPAHIIMQDFSSLATEAWAALERDGGFDEVRARVALSAAQDKSHASA